MGLFDILKGCVTLCVTSNMLKSVNFRIPEQDLHELREFKRKWSKIYPKLSISQIIRRGIRYEMDRIEGLGSETESHQATRLFEKVTDLFRNEFEWERKK